MKYLFPALCWLVPAAGLFIACTKKPQPRPPEEVLFPLDTLSEGVHQ